MAGHPEELPLLGGVAALLGASIVEHRGAGACRVFSGNGLVAKVGPPEVIAREAAVLRTPLPVAVPPVVDLGPGWLVTTAEDDDDSPWTDAQLDAALADLGRLHDAFEASLPDPLTQMLRQPFTPQGCDRLLEPVRQLEFDLPAPLDGLLADPAPIVTAAAAEPPTLLHGDPWPGNVLRPAPDRRVWIDWEMAGIGPAAADVASWINQAPWHPAAGGRPADRPPERDLEAYVAARSRPIDLPRFHRGLDAAALLWFLAYDVPQLAAGAPSPARAQTMVASALAALDRLDRM